MTSPNVVTSSGWQPHADDLELMHVLGSDGATVADLVHKLGRPKADIRAQLHYLRQMLMVVVVGQRGSADVWMTFEGALALLTPTQARVREFFLNGKNATNQSCVEEYGISLSTVQRSLRRMRELHVTPRRASPAHIRRMIRWGVTGNFNKKSQDQHKPEPRRRRRTGRPGSSGTGGVSEANVGRAERQLEHTEERLEHTEQLLTHVLETWKLTNHKEDEPICVECGKPIAFERGESVADKSTEPWTWIGYQHLDPWECT